MRHPRFAWPEMAMPSSFMLVLLFLLGVSGGCRGQVPTPPVGQGGDTTLSTEKTSAATPIIQGGVNPYKDKPWIGVDNDKNKIFSYGADGLPMDFDWERMLYKSKFGKFSLSNAKIIVERPLDTYFIYRIKGDYENLKTKFEDIGVRLPMNLLKKSATLHYRYYHSYYGAYLFSHLSVELFDYVDDKDYEIAPIFTMNEVEAYNYKGEHIAHIENKLPLDPSYVFNVSEDQRYILIGTSYAAGEGQSDYGDFILYDTRSHKTSIVPKIDINKYPGNRSVQSIIFDDSLFQIIYYNGTEGMRFMLDPYKRLLYYRFYPRPTLVEIYRQNDDITLPTLPDGTIQDVSQYEITSF